MINGRNLILISVIAYGIWAIFQKLAVIRLHPIHIQIVGCCVAITLLPIYLTLSYYKIPQQTISTSGIIFAVLASVCSIIATLAFLFAIKSGNDVGTTSVLVSASPVITIALAIIFLGEKLTFSKLIGVALIMFGVVILGH
jgi:transporter family protein